MLKLIDAGWQVGEFSSVGAVVRYSRRTDQRMLSIEHVDPQRLHAAPAWQGHRVE